jgi:hypothetical protein
MQAKRVNFMIKGRNIEILVAYLHSSLKVSVIF